MESPFWQAEGWLRWLGLFLSGVCHQFPEHSLFVADVHLPLCARCTGTYLGALLGMVSLFCRGRARAGRLPSVSVLLVLGAFLALWVVDGMNSYAQFASGRIWLYRPSNLLRLATGTLNGLALSLLVVPLFNTALWHRPDEQRVITDWTELAGLLSLAIGLVVGLQFATQALLYPLLFLQVLSVIAMLSVVNGIIVILALRRENQAECWREAILPLALGLLLSVCEVGSLALMRHFFLRTALLAPAL